MCCGSCAGRYLLQNSDIVTLHVPGSERTKNMITATELAMMKPGSQLINNARGDVVDLDDLAASLESGHLSGAAVDVYPKEPKGNTDFGAFDTPLLNLPNVILTPVTPSSLARVLPPRACDILAEATGA
eukprot:COSAG01_NODE_103_length_26263_cov_31.957728_4_plen_129_part_00